MNKCVVAVIIILGVSASFGVEKAVLKADTASVKIETLVVKKQSRILPKKTTNWSRIKDLFM